MRLRENQNNEYTTVPRWTPEQAAQWYIMQFFSADFKTGLEIKYPGGFWTSLNGQVVFVKRNGEIAAETLPSLRDMHNIGDGNHIGGAGRKAIYADKYGRQYIFKPSVSKAGVVEPFRALIQQAVSQIAARVFSFSEYVPLHIDTTADGVTGSVQPLIPGVIGNLRDINWRFLPPEQIRDIQREHVLDWTVGNFNSHPGNFILVERGQVLGVDKEQAFRFIDDPDSLRMSLNYHPNRQYGIWGPIYNEIYRDYAEAKIDLDLGVVEGPLDRLESISEEEYREILTPYAESLRFPVSFYEKALERKRKARAEFHVFFAGLQRKREGLT